MKQPRKPCPVCGVPLKEEETGNNDTMRIQCRNCGDHLFSQMAIRLLDKPHYLLPAEKALIAYRVRPIANHVRIDRETLHDWVNETKLPGAVERVDRLLTLMATRPDPMEPHSLAANHIRAAVGAATHDQARWVMDAAKSAGYLQGRPVISSSESDGYTFHDATLSMAGWARYEESIRRAVDSRNAFMAMAFTPDMWDVFTNHMQKAVAAADFNLMTTADARLQKAGNIVARMKVEIRNCRFMVCDLSHGNQGAYWEAGFAEGLGRPVIYTCRADVMADKKHPCHPHFDTAQQQMVVWDAADPAPAMKALTALVRNTLHAEAKMTDD